MANESKKPTAPYILEARKNELTFDEAVEKILAANNITTAPIPVVPIAESLGFVVYSASFSDKNVAGVMADSAKPVPPFTEKRVIAVNRDDYATRQNFTVAHEIAHFVLHCNDTDNFYERYMHGLDQGQRPEIENMANAFAAKLLMPEKMIRDFVKTLPETATLMQAVSEIAVRFIVSPTAAARRLDELAIQFVG